ncbi:MAG: radical SAM protein [Fibrobacterota bacterium]
MPDKHGVFRKMLEKSSREFRPYRAMLEVTNRCDQACLFCYILKEKIADPPLSRLKEYIERLASEGVLELTITGGEPFLRDDLYEICECADKNGFCITLFSNASAAKPEIIEKLSPLSIRSVEMTIFDTRPEVHDGFTRKKGAFDSALRNIMLMKDKGLNPVIKTPLVKQNFDRHVIIHEYFKKLGIKQRSSFETLCASGSSYKDAICKKEEYTTFFSNWRNMPGNRDFPDDYYCPVDSYPGEQVCKGGANMIAVSPWGDIFPCPSLRHKTADLNSPVPLTEQLRNSPLLKEIHSIAVNDIEKCRECSLNTYCKSCPSSSFLATGSYFKPSPVLCRAAEGYYAAFYPES